jgi:hypothetical protein
VPESHADPTIEVLRERGYPCTTVLPAGFDDWNAEGCVPVGERCGRRKVGLCQTEQRAKATVVRRHETSVDESRPGLRVCECHDHDEQFGVGDHGTFDRVGVIRSTAQQAAALRDADHPRERVRPTGYIADQRDPVADHDRAAPHIAAADGDHLDVTGPARVPATVDRDHETVDGVLVRGSGARARARSATGTDPDVVLVEAIVP